MVCAAVPAACTPRTAVTCVVAQPGVPAMHAAAATAANRSLTDSSKWNIFKKFWDTDQPSAA
jgi:hypothetical protein